MSESLQTSIFPERLITGFQPARAFHLGHLVGAVLPSLRFQDLNPGECFVLIADLHFLTGQPPSSELEAANLSTVRSLLALGLDPAKCVIYQQSAVPQVCELMWALSCYIGKNVLDRGHAYKAAIESGRAVSVGLFLYPLLQAADILAVRATRVPAGPDQRHHIELARAVSRRMNSLADVAVLPEPSLAEPPTMLLPGTDGVQKMSVQNNNVISIFEEEMVIESQINSIASVNVRVGTAVPPDQVPALRVLSLVAPPGVTEDATSRMASGGLDMSELKDLVLEHFLLHFEPARQRYLELRPDASLVRDVLADGADRARREVADTVLSVRELIGY